MRPFFGHLTLSEVTPNRIVQYKAKRYADKIKPATINRDLAIMKNAFNIAICEWEWCRENPVFCSKTFTLIEGGHLRRAFRAALSKGR